MATAAEKLNLGSTNTTGSHDRINPQMCHAWGNTAIVITGAEKPTSNHRSW
jgi:hypothetical protein